MATEVKVPTLGESITEATLGQWLKKPGDPVKADEPIASLETDKVAVEVPSPVAGTMGEQLVREGDTVAVGAVIARVEASGAPAAAAPTQAQPAAPPPKESAEHRRDAHHLQRRRHDGGDGGAQPLQGSVREEAPDPPRLHGLLREGGGARGQGRPRRQ